MHSKYEFTLKIPTEALLSVYDGDSYSITLQSLVIITKTILVPHQVKDCWHFVSRIYSKGEFLTDFNTDFLIKDSKFNISFIQLPGLTDKTIEVIDCVLKERITSLDNIIGHFISARDSYSDYFKIKDYDPPVELKEIPKSEKNRRKELVLKAARKRHGNHR